MFIQIKNINDFLSLIALFCNFYVVYSLDPILMMGFIITLFTQDFIKELTTGCYPSIFKRPDGAYDCSIFNTGGLADKHSGFPSGHVAVVSFVMNILYFRNKVKDYKSFFYYNIPIILVSYARIMKGCHNLIQVIAGYTLGFIIASILFNYQNNIYEFIKMKIIQKK